MGYLLLDYIHEICRLVDKRRSGLNILELARM